MAVWDEVLISLQEIENSVNTLTDLEKMTFSSKGRKKLYNEALKRLQSVEQDISSLINVDDKL